MSGQGAWRFCRGAVESRLVMVKKYDVLLRNRSSECSRGYVSGNVVFRKDLVWRSVVVGKGWPCSGKVLMENVVVISRVG
jgi:hypothetical protein